MKPTLVQYEAPPFGTGELWLDGARVLWSELPKPDMSRGQSPGHVDQGHVLAGRLAAFFAGEADDFADVELDLADGFYGDCERVLRTLPRGEVVTYGELAALAGRPGAARAAGTFCARNRLGPFVPCHRVVAAGGIGSYGSLGIDYKRRLLALEGWAL
jgi:methylated-DNA-[protein]-cysteine S-methyltransferase